MDNKNSLIDILVNHYRQRLNQLNRFPTVTNNDFFEVNAKASQAISEQIKLQAERTTDL